MIWVTEEDIGSWRRKLKIKIGGNDSLSIEHKEEIHICYKSMDLLICSILNNNFRTRQAQRHIHTKVSGSILSRIGNLKFSLWLEFSRIPQLVKILSYYLVPYDLVLGFQPVTDVAICIIWKTEIDIYSLSLTLLRCSIRNNRVWKILGGQIKNVNCVINCVTDYCDKSVNLVL